MVEHVTIVDADRHEAKHADTALNKQVLIANGDGTTKFSFVSYQDLTDQPVIAGYRQVLRSNSVAATQAPVSLDTALQVEFGGLVSTADVTLSSTGTLTFHTAGDYLVQVSLSLGRTSMVGTSVLLSRILLNGVQILNTSGIKLTDQEAIVPYNATIGVQATPTNTFQMQILRDSSGINNGGLFRILPTAAGWNLCPTASIVVSKFVGVA